MRSRRCSGAHPDYTRPVRRAMEYIRARLGDSITLADLAAHADLDKFHLCRAFARRSACRRTRT